MNTVSNSTLDQLGRKMIEDAVKAARGPGSPRLADIPVKVGALCILAAALANISEHGIMVEKP